MPLTGISVSHNACGCEVSRPSIERMPYWPIPFTNKFQSTCATYHRRVSKAPAVPEKRLGVRHRIIKGTLLIALKSYNIQCTASPSAISTPASAVPPPYSTLGLWRVRQHREVIERFQSILRLRGRRCGFHKALRLGGRPQHARGLGNMRLHAEALLSPGLALRCV